MQPRGSARRTRRRGPSPTGRHARSSRATARHAAQASSTKAKSHGRRGARSGRRGRFRPQTTQPVPARAQAWRAGPSAVSLADPVAADGPVPRRILPWGIIPADGRDHAAARTTYFFFFFFFKKNTNPSRPTPDHFRHSYTKDKAQLVRRLSRIEGQVRGIARMIEREEYCVDILQQTAALRAAVDAVSIMVLEDHVQGCVRTAADRGEADRYVDEVVDVVRRTLGRPVRTSGRSA